MTSQPNHVPSFTLNNGRQMPVIGIGCWQGYVGGGPLVVEAIEHALKVGYRHIDTAFNYGNESQVGQAIVNSGIPREELFVTTKLDGPYHDAVEKGLQTSLDNLGLEYVDLFLMHWPQAVNAEGRFLQPDEHPTIIDTWKDMEKLVATGKVKSIGVSNLSIKTLDILLPYVEIIPAVNQVEMHPLLPQLDLLEYCKEKSIVVTAYTPLGKRDPALLEHPVLTEIQSRRGCTGAQVLLGWAVKHGAVAIPKSVNKQRIEQNLAFVEDLSAEEMAALDGIHKAPGMHRSACKYHSNDGGCFGWTYEQLGWPMTKGGVVW